MRDNSNLPPGVTVGMIPGCRPEDEEWEGFEEWALEEFRESGLTVDECRRIVTRGVGIALGIRERKRKRKKRKA